MRVFVVHLDFLSCDQRRRAFHEMSKNTFECLLVSMPDLVNIG